MIRRTRTLSFAIAFTAIALGGMFLGASSAQADGDKPCVAKKFEFKQVEKACKDGGQTAAKALMKKVVKEQKAAGDDISCKSCHTSVKTFDLKDNAVQDLKKYLK